MSDKSCDVSSKDQTDDLLFLANRSRLLDIAGTYSLSQSPDSDGCNFNLSQRGDNTSPSTNTLSTGAPMMTHCNTSSQGKLFTNFENTFIATPDRSSINFWNDNLSLLSNQEFEGNNTFYKTASEGSSSALVSPDSIEMSSCRTSCRGSMDFSFSSGEMVVRSNSFCLEEQSPLFSSLEESPAPPVTSHVESKSLLTPLCEIDGARNPPHPFLEKTFTFGEKLELPSEEDNAMSNSFLALPNESHSIFATFLCENSTADCANEAQLLCPEAEPLSEAKLLATSDQGVVFLSPVCAEQSTDKVIHTSTPLQNPVEQMSSPPSFSASPCTESDNSPALRSVLKMKSSLTPKQFEKGPPTSGGKVTKVEIHKFPKSDFSSIKCKVISRVASCGSVLLNKSSQFNNKHEAPKSVRPSPTKINNGTTTPVSKTVLNSQKRPNMRARNDQTNMQRVQGLPSPTVSEDIHAKTKLLNKVTAPQQGASNQADAHPKPHNANATFIYPEKSPQKILPKPTNNNLIRKIKKVNSGSALGQDKSTPNTRPRCNSENSTTLSRLLKIQRPSANFMHKTDNQVSKNKLGNQDVSQSKPGSTKETTETGCRKVKKIGLVPMDFNASTAASSAESKTRFCRPSPNQTSRPVTSRASAVSPQTATPLSKRAGTSGRESCRTSASVATPLPKQKSIGSRKGQTTGETSLGPTPAATTKPNSSQHLQTPSRSSLMGPPPTPVSRLQQCKSFGPNRNQNEAGPHSETAGGARTGQVSGVAGRRATPFKAAIIKTRLIPTPAKSSGPVLTTSCKSATTSKGLPNGHVSPQKRTPSSKLIRLSTPVDKSKPKAAPRPQQQPPPERGASRPQQSNSPQDGGPSGASGSQRQDQRIQQLQALLLQSNNRCEAFAVVMQQTLAQRDEAVRQCRGLSQEMVDLRGELLSTVNKSECLEKEKGELRAALQDAVERVQEQHQRDVLELEQRLRESYQAEWSAAQQAYRDEAERCTALMQQQMGELKAGHEAVKQELEQSHAEELLSMRQQYERSLEELRNTHNQELQSLNTALKEAEVVLSEKIQELTRENDALMEKLTEEENRRKSLSQKDSHTVYLEQELESLKVVLDIKNQQLHQQEKKLMEVNKLTEKSVKLDESLRKVQQENEDLKARMERHAALSRQLSTEQALLQESLQKESKVNKRLSMENEELLWKLHNGDLGSPRKASPGPSSPPAHFSLQSPRSPALFSSPPLSPR